MNKTYQFVTSTLVLATASLAFVAEPMSAHAAVTLVGTQTDLTGIDGLVIDGNTYNVDFVGGSYNSVYSSVLPTFFGNATGASDAAVAIASALNTLDPTAETESVGIFIPDTIMFTVDNQGFQLEHNFNQPFFTGTYSINTSTVLGGVENGSLAVYTEFSQVTAVPLPATWALLILGVFGLGVVAYRPRSKPMLLAA
jgi:hypothetical protein